MFDRINQAQVNKVVICLLFLRKEEGKKRRKLWQRYDPVSIISLFYCFHRGHHEHSSSRHFSSILSSRFFVHMKELTGRWNSTDRELPPWEAGLRCYTEIHILHPTKLLQIQLTAVKEFSQPCSSSPLQVNLPLQRTVNPQAYIGWLGLESPFLAGSQHGQNFTILYVPLHLCDG